MEENQVQATVPQEPQPQKKSRLPLLIGVVVIVIAAIVAIAVGMSNQKAAKKETYFRTVEDARTEMIGGAVIMEDMCNRTMSVWYNCIYEEDDEETDPYTKNVAGRFYDDFNDALSNLFSSEVFATGKTQLDENKESVDNYMRELQDPPEGCENAHDKILDLYEAYTNFAQYAQSPTGSYNDYSTNVMAADSTFMNKFDVLDAVIP